MLETAEAPHQCRGKAAPYPVVGGATIRRSPAMYIVLVSVRAVSLPFDFSSSGFCPQCRAGKLSM